MLAWDHYSINKLDNFYLFNQQSFYFQSFLDS